MCITLFSIFIYWYHVYFQETAGDTPTAAPTPVLTTKAPSAGGKQLFYEKQLHHLT